MLLSSDRRGTSDCAVGVPSVYRSTPACSRAPTSIGMIERTRVDDVRHHRQQALDVLGAGGTAGRQADAAARQLVAESERRQHVRDFERPRRAGRAAGRADVVLVEVHQDRLAVRLLEDEAGAVRQALVGWPVRLAPGIDARMPSISRSRSARVVLDCGLGRSSSASAAPRPSRRSPRRSRCRRAGRAPGRRRARRRAAASRAARRARRHPSGRRSCGRSARAGLRRARSGRSPARPAAWTASVWKVAPWRCAMAAASAIGWIVPTSLFAIMTETRIVPGPTPALELVQVDDAVSVDADVADSEARRASPATRRCGARRDARSSW